VELYESAELVDCWHDDSCSCEVSLRYWNLIGRRFRGLSGVKTVENSRQHTKPEVNVTVANTGSHLSLFEFSLVKNKGDVGKEGTKIIIHECHYVCQGKQRLVQLSCQSHQLPVCRQGMKETNTDRP
jgi:hypothetical protein